MPCSIEISIQYAIINWALLECKVDCCCSSSCRLIINASWKKNRLWQRDKSREGTRDEVARDSNSTDATSVCVRE